MAKVLLISLVYEPDTVSTAGIVAGLAKGLRDNGHDVLVLSSVPHYNPAPDVLADRRYRTGFLRPYRSSVEEGVRVVRCFVPRKRGRVLDRALDFALFHLTLMLAAVRFFRRDDVAVVVSPPLTLAFVAFLLRVVGRTKVIYNAQELWPDVPKDLGVITSPFVLRMLGIVEQAIYRHADAVTPIGERFGDIIRSRGARRDRVVVIPNFVDTTWITPRPKANPLSEEWGVAERPVALYAGNIGLTQDFELVLDAAAKMSDVEFVFVGGGASLPALESLVAERRLPNVQLRPYVDSDRVADLYGLADVVMVPLRAGHDRTTTPSKIFSAMAAGKPILACAAPDTDLADELGRSSAGVVVPAGDTEAFVHGMRQLLDSDAGAQWSREQALASATMHSAGEVAARYDGLIRRLVDESASS